jgi:hypothetical protein
MNIFDGNLIRVAAIKVGPEDVLLPAEHHAPAPDTKGRMVIQAGNPFISTGAIQALIFI